MYTLYFCSFTSFFFFVFFSIHFPFFVMLFFCLYFLVSGSSLRAQKRNFNIDAVFTLYKLDLKEATN